MPRAKLGDLLVSTGLLSPEQLERALAEQKQWPNVPLGRILLDLGFVREEDLIKVLSVQLGIPIVHLEDQEIPPDVVGRVPADFCQKHSLVPFRYESTGRFLDVAMVEPLNLDVLDELRVVTQANVRPYFATYSAVAQALLRYYGVNMLSGGPARPVGGVLGTNEYDDYQRAMMATSLGQEFGPATLEHHLVDPGPTRLTRESRGEPSEDVQKELQELRRELERVGHLAQEGSKSLRASIEKLVKRVAGIEAEIKAIGELARTLSERQQRLEAFQERDERVLRKLLGLVVDKGLCSAEELTRLLQKS